LTQAIQERTREDSGGTRGKEEDKRKKQGQEAQKQENLLNYQNMIALLDPEEQEVILVQLQVPLGGDPDFQARLDASKDPEGNIELAKAHCLIDELILRGNTSFSPRR
jgi:hypothetical protein